MRLYGVCAHCANMQDGYLGDDGQLYCDDCWERYLLRRNVTIAAVYNHQGERLSVASSSNRMGCAERQALWETDIMDDQAKIVVVCRIRRNRNMKKASMGDSKPCQLCIVAMQMYNVTHVYYSIGKEKFAKGDVSTLQNDLKTASKCIIKT